MSVAEREAQLRKHLDAEVWPTDEEMRAFVKECESNPHSVEDFLADLQKLSDAVPAKTIPSSK